MIINNLTLFTQLAAIHTLFFNRENYASLAWKLFFQDNPTPEMEGLHNNIMFHFSNIFIALISVILLCMIITITNRKANLLSSNVMDLNHILEPKVINILKEKNKKEQTIRLNLKLLIQDDYTYICDKLERSGSNLRFAYIPSDPTLYRIACRSYYYHSYCIGKTNDLYREALMVQGELCSGSYLNILSFPNVYITSENKPLVRNEDHQAFVIQKRRIP